MSRYCEVRIRVQEYDESFESEIREAVEAFWTIDDVANGGNDLWLTGRDHLNAGYSEQALVDDLAVAIWAANEGWCKVIICIVRIDDAPKTTYDVKPADYAYLMHKRADEPKQTN